MGKLKRNAIGGVLALMGGLVVVRLLHGEGLGLLGWFMYCGAVGLGANFAHGQADVASITKGLVEKK